MPAPIPPRPVRTEAEQICTFIIQNRQGEIHEYL